MNIILGIDPGLRTTGWGIISAKGSQIGFIGCGIIQSNPKDTIASRLRQLHDGLQEVLHYYKPLYGAIEETFVNNNALSSLKLGHARGVLLLTAQLAGINMSEYSPNLVKKSIVGVGHADKKQVLMMVNLLLPKAKVTSEDAADALAIAICHSHHVDFINKTAVVIAG